MAGNPAVSGALLRRLVDEHFQEVKYRLSGRRYWSDEQFDALADHPDPDVRVELAGARHATPEQRARLVEDSSPKVLMRLAQGRTLCRLPFAVREPALPQWAYDRVTDWETRRLARKRQADDEAWVFWAPRDRPQRRSPTTAPADKPLLERRYAEDLTRSSSEFNRERAAADPRLPADLLAELAADQSPAVRLTASMHPSLTEEQRAAIDYRVAPEDRIEPARWARTTRDPQQQRQCVYSAHIGLRRSVAYNNSLSPDLVAVLAEDDDFAVRLLLCENHADVPGEVVLATFLEATTLTRDRLLDHPALRNVRLAELVNSPDPIARCLVVRDPDASPELVERLSYDPHPWVRASTAHDARLSPDRVLELFDDPLTTEGAAANRTCQFTSWNASSLTPARSLTSRLRAHPPSISATGTRTNCLPRRSAAPAQPNAADFADTPKAERPRWLSRADRS